jgi:hypothetical protein
LDPTTRISGTEVPVPDSTRFLRSNSNFAIHLSFFAWLPFFFFLLISIGGSNVSLYVALLVGFPYTSLSFAAQRLMLGKCNI